MNVDDQQQNAKYAALQAMAAGQNLGPDPYSDAQQGALAKAAQTATGVPADYQSSLDAQIAGPRNVADQAIANNDAASRAVIDAANNYGATAGGPTTLPSTSVNVGGATGSDATSLLKMLLSEYNTNLNPGGFKQYGGYHTAGEHDNAVLGRAQDLAAQQAQFGQGEHLAGQSRYQIAFGPAKAAAQTGLGAPAPPGTTGMFGDVNAAILAAKRKADAATWAQAAAKPPAMPGVFGQVQNSANPQTVEAAMQPAGGGMFGAVGRVEGSLKRQADAVNSALGNAAHELAASAALRDQGQQLVQVASDPTQLYQFARTADTQLGVDPYIAAGQWSPEWSMGYAKNIIGGQNAYNAAALEHDERAANAQRYGAPLTNTQVKGMQDDTLRSSPVYGAGAKIAEGLLNDWAQQDPNQPGPSVDELKQILAVNGVNAPAVVDLLLKDYGQSFPSAAYIPPGSLPSWATGGG